MIQKVYFDTVCQTHFKKIILHIKEQIGKECNCLYFWVPSKI